MPEAIKGISTELSTARKANFRSFAHKLRSGVAEVLRKTAVAVGIVTILGGMSAYGMGFLTGDFNIADRFTDPVLIGGAVTVGFLGLNRVLRGS